ncbi:MAG: acetylxylan esterase [Ginsengibacter sp.]
MNFIEIILFGFITTSVCRKLTSDAVPNKKCIEANNPEIDYSPKLIRSHSNFFKIVFITSIFVGLVNIRVKAQNDLDVIKNWIQFSDASNSLYHDLADQAYSLLDKREEKIAGLHSLSDWQQRQQWIHKKLLKVVGPFPERTPLNAKIIRAITKDNYKVEHIVFESQPGFYVTSSLFIPASVKSGGKAPAIIYCSGHTDQGYRHPIYQQAILNLVEKGFIVFAFDPIDQGERYEYYDPETKKSIIGERDEEHSYIGAQPFISGSSLAKYMIWDGIRAIDYLLTRKEVDPARIGITGRSGGGTQSAYIAAFDNRIKAAAPGNYITNFTRLIQTSGPQCAEQDPFNFIAQGLDIPDLLVVRAPKPTLVIATTRDKTFSIQGAMEAAKEVSRIYKAYNKEKYFNFVTDDTVHASTKKDRESIYAFFQKFLLNPGDSTEEKVKLLSPEELQVTATGQVSTSYGSETVYSLNKKETQKLEAKLQASRKNLHDYLPKVLQSAKRLSGYQQPTKTNCPVFTGRFQKEGYVIEKYFVKGEGDYIIPYLLMKPDLPNHRALIYLDPSGKSTEAGPGGEMEWFVKKGFTVLAPDMLGVGEMGPGVFHGDSYIKGVSYNIWFLSMLIGRSIVGIQGGDVVRLARLMKETKGIDEVYGLAKKEMSPVLLYAAAFDSTITRIALIEPYSSYLSLVTNRFYCPAFVHSAVPGALTAYDLPDLAASLAPRKLTIERVTDGTGNSADSENISKDLSVIKAAYHNQKADNQLNIMPGESIKNLQDVFQAWIK